MEGKFSLREKVEDAKFQYAARYGALDWRFTDEGLPWTIQDYHGSKGSVMDFTKDDWCVCKENRWSLDEIVRLCDEPWFCSDVQGIGQYLEIRIDDWKANNNGDICSYLDEDVPQDIVTDFVADFYAWRNKLLPSALHIYGN